MIRKAVILVLVTFFMTLFIFTAMMYLKNEQEVYSSNEVVLIMEKPSFFAVDEINVSNAESDMVRTYGITLFTLPIGTYTVVERTVENGTRLLFEELENTSWIPYTLSLNAVGLKDGELKSWNPREVRRAEDPIYGNIPLVNPYGSIKLKDKELLQGNLYVSKKLVLGNGDEVTELRHEIPDFSYTGGTLAKNFWLPPKHQAQTWMMVAEEPLFESEKAEDEWIDFSLNDPLKSFNWLTPEGPLVKLPLTDDLRTQMAYSLNPEHTATSTLVEWNEASSSLFSETLLLNSGMDLKE